MLIESRPATDPEVGALVDAQQREVRAADGGLDGQVSVTHDDIRYLVVVAAGRAVGLRWACSPSTPPPAS